MNRPDLQRSAALFWLVLLAAGGTFALTMGTRQTMGLFMGPLNTATGLGLASISLAFAFGQLWWGLTQPFAGAVADRLGPGRVLTMGILLVALGTALTPWMNSTPGLILAIGVLAAGGAGMAGPAVLMSAVSRRVTPAQRGLANGVVNAGGSFGQFAMAPLAAWLLAHHGWSNALLALAAVVLLALPAAWVLGRSGPASAAASPTATGAAPLSATAALAMALRTSSYVWLGLGFFVCGFHVAFLATHLPGVVAACGLSAQWAGWALSMIGLFNIVGSVFVGWACNRWRMRSILSIIYATRALAILLFLAAPKTEAVVLAFAAVMGLTFLSTVPPTAGLVAKFFGLGNMAMLFGLVMLSHQIGGFLGAWLGGTVFEATGSYDGVWIADAVLALGAALVHLPIQEAAPRRPVAPA